VTRTWWNGIERAKLMAWAVGALAGLTGILWTAFAEPRIDCKIKARVDPIEDAITYQNYLMMENMDSARVRAATEKYLMFEKGRVARPK
jgi:hypothetical protein